MQPSYRNSKNDSVYIIHDRLCDYAPSLSPSNPSSLIAAKGSGRALKLPHGVRGSGRSPAAKCILVHFSSKLSHLVVKMMGARSKINAILLKNVKINTLKSVGIPYAWIEITNKCVNSTQKDLVWTKISLKVLEGATLFWLTVTHSVDLNSMQTMCTSRTMLTEIQGRGYGQSQYLRRRSCRRYSQI